MSNGDNAAAFDVELIAHAGLVDTTQLKHLKLSPDGTCLISVSVSEDPFSNSVTTTVLPPDLLTATRPVTIDPYCKGTVNDPIRAIACYPFYELSDPTTTLAVLSIADQPIRLFNTLSPGLVVSASYKYINPQTEAFISPYSLIFMPGGEYFIAGADSELSVFNAHRNGEGPTETYKFKKRFNGGRSQWELGRGIISSLDISCDGYLAAGSWSSKVSIYASQGRGDCITTFSIEAPETPGSGVSQLRWSGCGNYLYIGQRMSDNILVFDIRGRQRLLQTLIGRNAESMLPHHFDVKDDSLFCGGLDGVVRIWDGLGKTEGDVQATKHWQAHDYACTWVKLHPLASVAITGSARDRHNPFPIGSNDFGSADTVSETTDSSEDDSVSDKSDEDIELQGTILDGSDNESPKASNQHIKVWSI